MFDFKAFVRETATVAREALGSKYIKATCPKPRRLGDRWKRRGHDPVTFDCMASVQGQWQKKYGPDEWGCLLAKTIKRRRLRSFAPRREGSWGNALVVRASLRGLPVIGFLQYNPLTDEAFMRFDVLGGR